MRLCSEVSFRKAIPIQILVSSHLNDAFNMSPIRKISPEQKGVGEPPLSKVKPHLHNLSQMAVSPDQKPQSSKVAHSEYVQDVVHPLADSRDNKGVVHPTQKPQSSKVAHSDDVQGVVHPLADSRDNKGVVHPTDDVQCAQGTNDDGVDGAALKGLRRSRREVIMNPKYD